MTTPEPALSVRNLSKTFPGQCALDGVSLDVMPGEIHALLGQNGSGKSTLIKCVSGYHQPDHGGEIWCGGKELPLGYASSEAHQFGLAFVHQDLGVVPSLTVLENFCLGKGFATGPLYRIRWKTEAKRVADLMCQFGHSISPWARVADLSSADRTIVAIARALAGTQESGQLLVLDEPTAALPQDQVDHLFEAIRGVAKRGTGILYVSHRLEEIFRLADRASVLREGKLVGTVDVSSLTMQGLVELILGRSLSNYYPEAKNAPTGETVLEVENLCGSKITDASFTMKRGEIVGVAGLLGSGCSELGRLLFGVDKRSSGVMRFKGKNVKYRGAGQAMRDGVALVTEDRRKDGSFGGLPLGQNISITDLRRFWRVGRIDRKAERQEIVDLIEGFDVRPPAPEKVFSTFSGGNQQKAIVAKWMRLHPDLLILDEPHVGIDIGSKTAIYGLTREAAAGGTAVILISSEFEDLMHMCDKVLVLRHGRIVAELQGRELTEQNIANAAYLSTQGNANRDAS